MKKLQTHTVAALLAAAALIVPGEIEAKEVKRSQAVVDVGTIDSVEIEHPVGDLDIRARRGDEIRIMMTVDCGKWFSGNCKEQGERLEIQTDIIGDELLIEIGNMPSTVRSLSVDMEIELPPTMHLQIEHGVGKTRIVGMERDVIVELGVGDVMIEGELLHYERVAVEVGVGDADFRAAGRKVEKNEGFLFLANGIDWNRGEGDYEIEVEVGVGDADVRLD